MKKKRNSRQNETKTQQILYKDLKRWSLILIWSEDLHYDIWMEWINTSLTFPPQCHFQVPTSPYVGPATKSSLGSLDTQSRGASSVWSHQDVKKIHIFPVRCHFRWSEAAVIGCQRQHILLRGFFPIMGSLECLMSIGFWCIKISERYARNNDDLFNDEISFFWYESEHSFDGHLLHFFVQ